MNQHTGNWPGKTVENAFGNFVFQNKNFLLVDLPGTYSLISHSPEEEIANHYICFGKNKCIIIVIDCTRLERSLNLVYQIMEITSNIVVCANLNDEAIKKGIHINFDKLSKLLGVPVVPTSAIHKKTLHRLKETINNVCVGKISPTPKKIKFSNLIEKALEQFEYTFEKVLPFSKRWLNLKLLDYHSNFISTVEKELNISIESNLDIQKSIKKAKKLLVDKNISSGNIKDIITTTIIQQSDELAKQCCIYNNQDYNIKDKKIDRILTSKKFGYPIMFLFLSFIFYLTITVSNYPSSWLSTFFTYFEDKLIIFFHFLQIPQFITEMLVFGMYRTLTWIISVMLPPMAIFFPLFTIFEDLGYLPRIAFNLDSCFKKCCSSGKQAITMCMGFGCNAAGVTGCRIIESERQRNIAILTNAFMPCNGRFPFIILLSGLFIAKYFSTKYSALISTFCVLSLILLGIALTLLFSKLLNRFLFKGEQSSFLLELPPFRKPQLGKIVVRSLFDRTIFVLGRAIVIAAPAGIVIWLMANIQFGELSIISILANSLDSFGKLLGLDGVILLAFILGIPANEIVLPIMLMTYLSTGSLIELEDTVQIGNILRENGWTLLTAINTMIFTLLHFPCSTTLLTIKKETNSLKLTIISFFLPTICGIILCFINTCIYNFFII